MSGLFGRTGTGAPQKGQLVCANPALDGGRAGTARGQTRKENTDKPQPHLAARLARLDIIDGLDKCRGGSSDAEQAGASTVSPRNSSPTRTAHSSSRRVLLTNDTHPSLLLHSCTDPLPLYIWGNVIQSLYHGPGRGARGRPSR